MTDTAPNDVEMPCPDCAGTAILTQDNDPDIPCPYCMDGFVLARTAPTEQQIDPTNPRVPAELWHAGIDVTDYPEPIIDVIARAFCAGWEAAKKEQP